MSRSRKPPGYWTKEKCALEASKYLYRGDFQKKSHAAYRFAYKKGLLDEICSHMKKKVRINFWTKEKCAAEASKFKTKTDFSKGGRSAYKTSLKYGWIDDVCSHMKNEINYNGYKMETLIHEASKYQTKRDFRNANPKMVLWAQRHKVMDKICAHMKPIGNREWRQLYAFEHPDKTVYVGQSFNPVYRYSQHLKFGKDVGISAILRRKNKKFGKKQKFIVFEKLIHKNEIGKKEQDLIEKYRKKEWKILNSAKGGALGGNVRKWTLERCIEVCRECKKRSEVQIKFPSAYNAIKKNSWKEMCFSHMGRGKIVSYSNDHLREVIRKSKSLLGLRKDFPLEYRAIVRRPNLSLELSGLKRIRKRHTEDEIFSCAKKYKTRIEFFRASPAEYKAAKRMGIFDQVVSHMKKKQTKSSI